jgi:hypothetical protein
MPITAGWDDHRQSIMLVSFVAPWTIDDFAETASRALEMVTGVEHRVDIIADIRHIGLRLPPLQLLRQVRKLWNNFPKNVRLVVRVGFKMPLEPANILFNIRRDQAEITVVDTLDKAYTAIGDHRRKTGDTP